MSKLTETETITYHQKTLGLSWAWAVQDGTLFGDKPEIEVAQIVGLPSKAFTSYAVLVNTKDPKKGRVNLSDSLGSNARIKRVSKVNDFWTLEK